MLDGVTLAVFLAATFVIMLTPGPDMLYVLARTLGEGRVAGLLAVLGIATAILVHTLLAAFGLSAFITTMPHALTVLRWIGAAYLVFLAWQTWRAGPASIQAGVPRPLQPWRVWREAFLTNILNPKALVFFLAFLPQFAIVGEGAFEQMLVLGLIVAGASATVNGALALAVGRLGKAIAERPQVAKSQRVVTAGILVAIAARILV